MGVSEGPNCLVKGISGCGNSNLRPPGLWGLPSFLPLKFTRRAHTQVSAYLLEYVEIKTALEISVIVYEYSFLFFSKLKKITHFLARHMITQKKNYTSQPLL